jgi:hypothetical protein
MEELEHLLQSILINDCPVKMVSNMIENLEVHDDNDRSIEEAVNSLKMHEAEIRMLRQELSTKLLNHRVANYLVKGKNLDQENP